MLILMFLLQADQRFTWNSYILKELSQQSELHRFCLPILHGCILVRMSCSSAAMLFPDMMYMYRDSCNSPRRVHFALGLTKVFKF